MARFRSEGKSVMADSEVTPGALREADVDADPFVQFRRWLLAAEAAGLPEPGPSAMTLATAAKDGKPSARMVLLRGVDERGFAFFTNYESRKSRELDANPWAALVFYWPTLDRQVRIEGRIERVSAAESDDYFQTRERGSQLGAWASPQSQVILDRDTLERRMEAITAQYQDRPVPRPPHWGGYRVTPSMIEFWQGRANRLHDRLCYRRREDGTWLLQRLAP
jgi:pyridoxamine 5'-phosphate oxidase